MQSYLSGQTANLDPINGSDGNDGITAPLRTLGELGRRLSGASLGAITRVVVASDCLNGDVLTIDDLLMTAPGQPAPFATLTIAGTPSVVRTGTVTAVQLENEASNIEWQINDSAVASWTPDVGRLLKTSTVACWILKDLGGGTARVSPPIAPPLYWDFKPIEGTFGVGDAYAVYTLPQVSLKSVRGDAWSDNNRIFFEELTVCGPQGSVGGSDIILDTGECGVTFRRCFLKRAPMAATGSSLQFVTLSNSYSNLTAGGFPFGVQILAGALVAPLGAGGQLILDGNVYLQGAPVSVRAGGVITIGKAAIFDCPGYAVVVPSGAKVINQNWDYGAHRLWGKGNGGGVQVKAGGSFTYDATVPTLNAGGPNEFSLSGASQARAWDDTILPNGGPTGWIACTWSNLGLPIASGGFGGQAVDFATMASVRQNA